MDIHSTFLLDIRSNIEYFFKLKVCFVGMDIIQK